MSRRDDAPSPRGTAGPLGARLGKLAATVLLLVGTAGCDNIVKYIPVFSTMTDTESIETYEEQPIPAPEGAVPVTGDDPDFELPVADTTTELQNPLAGTEAQLARGDSLYGVYCLTCHGPEGKGEGPAVNWDGQHPRRFPYIPTVNLTTETGPMRSDGYMWGMIENGRGLMPAYRRIPEEDRWYIIEYVRKLQRDAGADPQRGVAGPDRAAATE
jgi:mono/diheme cytochrome c family protein